MPDSMFVYHTDRESMGAVSGSNGGERAVMLKVLTQLINGWEGLHAVAALV